MRYPAVKEYRITSDFAAHLARGSTAPGIDLALPDGSAVLAAGGGRVIRCEWGDAGGRYVMIEHGGKGMITLYSHLSAVLRVKGERVKAGDVIGLSGNTGHSTGPHLHFAVKQDGRWVDPEPLLVLERAE